MTEIRVSFPLICICFWPQRDLMHTMTGWPTQTRSHAPVFLADPLLYHEPLAQRTLALTNCSWVHGKGALVSG